MTRWPRIVLGAAALGAIALFAALAVLRLPYPFELEWQEGGVLDHVQRVIAGEPIYVEPSLEFIAFPYPPLYYHASAALTRVVGEGFVALRLVSILASAVTLALLFVWGKSRAGSFAGLACAGLFAAGYRFGGAWLDIARVDALFLALTLAGYVTLESALQKRSRTAALLGGLLFFLACWTKQSALFAAVPIIALAFTRDRALGMLGAAAFFVPYAGATWFVDRATDGWFRWYVFQLLAGHPWIPERVPGFWIELALHLSPAFLLPVWVRYRLRPSAAPASLLPALVAGLLAVSWIGRAHAGGYDNTLLPAILAASLLFGPALARALEAAGRPLAIATVAGVVQFAMLAYDPRAQLPSDADRAVGERVVQELRAVEGELFVPYHGYLAERAGHGGSAHAMAIIDLLSVAPEPGAPPNRTSAAALHFVAQMDESFRTSRWSAVVLDDDWERDLPSLAEQYPHVTPLFEEEDESFLPVTGAPWRPERVYRPAQ